jgi:dephospho-CoA kinase
VRVGLTGGIGSGKSTAAQWLAEMGAQVVDSDAISRSLTATGGAALPALAAVFGPDVIGMDGALDRARMRALVFADAQARRRLEGVLHPMIAAETERQAAAAGDRPVVFDVPLLVESGHWRRRVDRVLVIDCAEATQVERVCRRPGWSEAMARAVVAQQATRAARRAIADAVIFNDGISLAQLQDAVKHIHARWADPPPGL